MGAKVLWTWVEGPVEVRIVHRGVSDPRSNILFERSIGVDSLGQRSWEIIGTIPVEVAREMASMLFLHEEKPSDDLAWAEKALAAPDAEDPDDAPDEVPVASSEPPEGVPPVVSDHEIQEEVLADLRTERKRQDRKWGVQNHQDGYWSFILAEELGEMAKAFLEVQPDRAREEAVHATAVLVAWIENMDRERLKGR
jgi:hypothetical protein